MADKEETPPPTDTAGLTSSPSTPASKRARMTSPDRPLDTKEDAKVSIPDAKVEENEAATTGSSAHDQPQSTESAAAPQGGLTEVEAEEDDGQDDLEADDEYADSTFGGSENSDTTSLSSSISHGIIENGRRYQAKREGEYYAPADEKQFMSYEAAHVVCLILEHGRKNGHFLSPIPETAQNILDVGTGSGIWAKEVADMFPSAVVRGVDLAPPPQNWVPPNCKLEVDDVLKPWDYSAKFDLVHLRDMYGAFSNEQWRLLYKQAYNNIAPGGWIEQMEVDIVWRSDDGSLPADSLLATWGEMVYPLCEKMGTPVDTYHHIRSRIEKAGFTNIHEKLYKVPVGDWVKNPVLKEAGRFTKEQFLEGMEGYVMFLLTRFGEPEPWQPEEVTVWLAKVREEINNPAYHPYYYRKRVWAQKPFDNAPKAASKTEVETFA